MLCIRTVSLNKVMLNEGTYIFSKKRTFTKPVWDIEDISAPKSVYLEVSYLYLASFSGEAKGPGLSGINTPS